MSLKLFAARTAADVTAVTVLTFATWAGLAALFPSNTLDAQQTTFVCVIWAAIWFAGRFAVGRLIGRKAPP